MTPINILALVFAYLIGSIPTSVWLGKYYYGIDLREHGSGNAGATNTFRVFGKKMGIAVLIIDVLKGWIAVKLFYVLYESGQNLEELFNLKIRLGICALLGHVFPIYVGFKGGKGVATLLGIVLALNHQAALASIALFLIVLIITGYVSLSSILAGIFFPVVVMVIFKTSQPDMVIFSLMISVAVIITHQKNIERLFSKKESRVNLLKGKKNKLDDKEEEVEVKNKIEIRQKD
ncbi:MAG: glycerol-3-phosphate 1-O-acyltransferase PlsY [Bacteroidia bacterium]|nr:glycerol-3-phosphate 1-O-acyltransferase PlsY [Bacteroidia bacterium]MCZ2248328.1 glycerol-3-phosphate 1-O-acyltransferase PlsY [Bacteroidia bacterium]